MIIIPAFAGATNVEELTIKDANGQPVDFAAIGVVAARIYAGGDSVECALGSNGEIRFVPGELRIKPMKHSAMLKLYAEGDTSGRVVAADGLPTSITIQIYA